MSFKARPFFAASFVISLLIQIQLAEIGYASRRTKIAFASSRVGENEEIYVMDGDGGNKRRVTVNPARDSLPAWSPDGAKIAFVSNRNNVNKDHKQIWVIDADGKNRIRLTDGLVDTYPDWSPRRHENSVRHRSCSGGPHSSARWHYCDGCGWEGQEAA